MTEVPDVQKFQPLKKRIDSIPDERIAQALIENEGLLYLTGEALGIDGSTVCKRVKDSPYLQEVVARCKETRIDQAEASLSRIVKRDELGGVCFTLKTVGKSRGYTEEIVAAMDQKIAVSHALLMAQIQSLKESNNLTKSATKEDKSECVTGE